MVLATREDPRERRRVLPEARPEGRAGLRRDRADRVPVGPHRRRDLPDRDRGRRAGARRWGRSRSTRGRCARDDVDHPDELRLDLDPQPGTDFADAVRVAGVARELLDELGYVGFPKTSGGRGIHIYVRIEPRWTFTDVRHAAIAFGRELERRLPGEVTTKWWKEERGERIFVDYNQNARDRTIASAYSIRPKPGAPVSAPLAWDELDHVQPEDFTVATMPARFAERRRPARRDRRRRALAAAAARPLRASRATATCPTRPTTRRCRASPSASSPRATATAALSRYGAACGSFFAPALRRVRRRRHDRADVAVGRLVEVDDHRRVVARALALAGLAVDPRGLDALGDVVAGEHEVDPHAAVLVEHPGAVVPVGEDALVSGQRSRTTSRRPTRLQAARAPRARAA